MQLCVIGDDYLILKIILVITKCIPKRTKWKSLKCRYWLNVNVMCGKREWLVAFRQGQHPYIGLSRWHFLWVRDQQLLHVVGRAVLLQLVLDAPYQLTLHLETRGKRNMGSAIGCSWIYKAGFCNTLGAVIEGSLWWLKFFQVSTFSLSSSFLSSSSFSFFTFFDTPSNSSPFLFLQEKKFTQIHATILRTSVLRSHVNMLTQPLINMNKIKKILTRSRGRQNTEDLLHTNI